MAEPCSENRRLSKTPPQYFVLEHPMTPFDSHYGALCLRLHLVPTFSEIAANSVAGGFVKDSRHLLIEVLKQVNGIEDGAEGADGAGRDNSGVVVKDVVLGLLFGRTDSSAMLARAVVIDLVQLLQLRAELRAARVEVSKARFICNWLVGHVLLVEKHRCNRGVQVPRGHREPRRRRV